MILPHIIKNQLYWLKAVCRKCEEENGALSNDKRLYVKNHATESDHGMLLNK